MNNGYQNFFPPSTENKPGCVDIQCYTYSSSFTWSQVSIQLDEIIYASNEPYYTTSFLSPLTHSLFCYLL